MFLAHTTRYSTRTKLVSSIGELNVCRVVKIYKWIHCKGNNIVYTKRYRLLIRAISEA